MNQATHGQIAMLKVTTTILALSMTLELPKLSLLNCGSRPQRLVHNDNHPHSNHHFSRFHAVDSLAGAHLNEA